MVKEEQKSRGENEEKKWRNEEERRQGEPVRRAELKSSWKSMWSCFPPSASPPAAKLHCCTSENGSDSRHWHMTASGLSRSPWLVGNTSWKSPLSRASWRAPVVPGELVSDVHVVSPLRIKCESNMSGLIVRKVHLNLTFMHRFKKSLGCLISSSGTIFWRRPWFFFFSAWAFLGLWLEALSSSCAFMCYRIYLEEPNSLFGSSPGELSSQHVFFFLREATENCRRLFLDLHVCFLF